jgi:TRAP-type uncharacterized transport system fused permease subunit
MPTIPIYIVVAIAAAPALLKIGIDLLPAHFFVLFLGVASFLTPPVAMAAIVAAGIAGSSYMRAAVQAVKIGIYDLFGTFFICLQPGDPGPVVRILRAYIVATHMEALLGSCARTHFLAQIMCSSARICHMIAKEAIERSKRLLNHSNKWMFLKRTKKKYLRKTQGVSYIYWTRDRLNDCVIFIGLFIN